jgi:hypothetical protein
MFTDADVNGWLFTIAGLDPANGNTQPVPEPFLDEYVNELNAGATPAQIQANLENFPFNSNPPPTNVITDTFFRTSVADFVLREFQLAWGVVPTSGAAASQYDAWVARVIDNPANMTAGGMSAALVGTPEFQLIFGSNPNATAATIALLCAHAGIPVGAGAMANVGLPMAQVLQNFAENSALVSNALAAPIANFQNLLLNAAPGAPPPSGSILTLPGTVGSSLTLTPGADTPTTGFSGGHGATATSPGAVFNALPVTSTLGIPNNTLNAGDNLQDTVGDGTLNFTATGTSLLPAYAVGVELNGIKTLTYTGSFAAPDGFGGFQGNVTGLTVVNDTGSTGGLQLGGVGQGLVTPLATVNITGYGPVGGIGIGTPAMFAARISALAGTAAAPIAVSITGPVGTTAPAGAAQLAISTDGTPGSVASPNAAYNEWDVTVNSTAFLQLSQDGVGGANELKLISTAAASTVAVGSDGVANWQNLTTIDASGDSGTVIVTGASAGFGDNAFATGTNPAWLFGSTAGLLDDTGAGNTFKLATFDLGTGRNVLDVSSATATELSNLTTVPAATVAADNVIIVSDAAATTTLPATFAKIAGFSELGVVAPAGTIDMANMAASGINEIIYFTGAAGAVTINNAVAGLTVDFHGNNGGFDATINGPTTGTDTLTLDFGNQALALQDNTGLMTVTGYSTVDINTNGDGTGPANSATGIDVSSAVSGGLSTALTVTIAGAQDFNTAFVTDVAGTGSTNAPLSAADVINVNSAITVDLGTTNFGTVNAGASTGLTVTDTWHNSTITGSATGDNILAGGDGGGLTGTGNTFTGGTATDTITTGIGSNTVNLAATHTGDSVTIASVTAGSEMVGPGDVANAGAWGQAFGSTPNFIAGAVAAPPSIFGNATANGTSDSMTTINNFLVSGTSTDHFQIQASLWAPTGTANNLGGTGINVGLADIGISAQVAAGSGLGAAAEVVTTSGQATTTGTNLVEISGTANTFGSAAALAKGLAAGGSFDLTFGSAAPLPTLDNVHFLVAYGDGANNIRIADVDIYNTTAAAVTNSNTAGVHVYASDLVDLVGVGSNSATSFAALNTHLHAFV